MGFVIRTPGSSSEVCQFWEIEAVTVRSLVCKMEDVWARGLNVQKESQNSLRETPGGGRGGVGMAPDKN